MAQVAATHGIAQQQLGDALILKDWRPALYSSIAKSGVHLRPTMKLAYYGDRFLSASQEGMVAMSGPQRSENFSVDFTEDELELLHEIADDPSLRDEIAAAPVDMAFPRVPKRVQHLAGWLGFKFGAAAPLLFIGELRQVLRYQSEPGLQAEVQSQLKAVLTPDCKVLIGHSLGAVVAFDALHLHEHNVELIVTLGSPLGLRTIRERLVSRDWPTKANSDENGQPLRVARWLDVRDPGDPVACAGPWIRQLWPEIDCRQVDNEGDPHAGVRYLTKKVVGATILDVLYPGSLPTAP
jgi:hypothetical protein